HLGRDRRRLFAAAVRRRRRCARRRHDVEPRGGRWPELTRARSFVAAAVVVMRVSASPPARAEAAGDLRVSLPVDISVTAGAATVWLASDLLKSQLAPLACRWCEANALDTAV